MRTVDDDPPIKTRAATQAYRDNWDRIFGEKEPEAKPDEDAIECTVKSYANYIAPAVNGVINDVEPVGVEIGWLCPCHEPNGDENVRRVSFIDREARIFRCEYTHNEDPIEHSFDDL